MDVVVNGEKEGVPPSQRSIYQQNILLALAYDPKHIPLADILKRYHGLEGQWLIASPIHWQASHNDAMLMASADNLQLSDEESRLWFSEICEFLKTDGFSPVYHDAHRWLFKIDDKPTIASQSLETLLHQSLMPVLSSLDNRFYWQRLITELQMYMNLHPLNNKREGLAINGLWFWGEGEFKGSSSRAIATDDEVLLNDTRLFSPLEITSSLSKDHLLIINDQSKLKHPELEKKINKMKVNWYWNNCEYTSPKKRWWTRL